jgi:uncharacterized protein YdgA (DUF945 family)
MNRIVVAVVVVAVAIILLATPPALGKLTETRVRERVAALNGSGVLSAEVKSFDRGWFRSSAKIELGLAPEYLAQTGALNAATASLAHRATIVVDFAHGPVTVRNGVHLGWSAMVARLDASLPDVAELEQRLGVPYVFEFRGHTGLSGAVQFDADVPAMDIPTGVARFKSSGAVLEGSYAHERLVSEAHVASLEFSSPTGSFTLNDLHASTRNRILSRYAAPGEGEFSIASVTATSPFRGGGPLFELQRLKITSSTSVDAAQALLDAKVAYGLDRLHIVDNDVSEASIGINLHNLDVMALRGYAETMQQLGASANADRDATLAALAPHIKRALAAGPTLTLEPLRFKFDGEPFEGHVELTTNAARASRLDGPDLDMLRLLGTFDGTADLRLSKALARRFATLAATMQLGMDARIPPDQLNYLAEAQSGLMLVTLVNQGLLIEDGDAYHTAIRFADGALTVNGSPLPLGLQ